MAAHVGESTLLAPCDPHMNSDEWPIFTLSSVEVFDGGSPVSSPSGFVSLLNADVDKPLTVRGKLNSIPRNLSHLRLRPSGGTELVEVENVRQFAYGQYEDGNIELWAAGRSGWFSLRPSRMYKSTFDSMVQAIEVLYFLADAYRSETQGTKSRKGKKREAHVSADELFATYASVNRLKNEDVARQIMERHAPFLVKSMVQGKENVNWQQTPIWSWMKQSRADLFGKANATPATAANAQEQANKKRKHSVIHQARRSNTSRTRDSPEEGSSRGHKSLRMSSEPGTPATYLSDATSVDTAGSRPRRGQKGKSVLRPKASKFIPAEPEILDEITVLDEASLGQNSHPVSNAKNAAAASQPRKLQEFTRTTTGADIDEGIDMSLDNSDHYDEFDDQSLLDDLMPPSLSSDLSAIPVRLRKEDLIAIGEGDTWTCPLDGCMHKVYAASEKSSQSLIKEHYRLHVNDEDTEVRMALVRRMHAPGLPISRLVGKIQQMSGNNGFPPPIARRY